MMEQDSTMGSGSRPHCEATTDLIERAFKYRGDVTVGIVDGQPLTGYLFNRNASCSEPFVQLFETATGREVTVLYKCIAEIQFSARDAAAASARHFDDSRRQ